jgi:hypothetical protein
MRGHSLKRCCTFDQYNTPTEGLFNIFYVLLYERTPATPSVPLVALKAKRPIGLKHLRQASRNGGAREGAVD